jgi:hypothetical protein
MLATSSPVPKVWPWLLTGLLALTLSAIALLNLKVVADGYLSHAVSVQLKIARYKWQSGNLRGATVVLWRTVPKAVEAGWRWQVARSYFLLARSHAQLDNPLRAKELCQAGLATLGYGRYDHTRNGTSTAMRKCDQLEASP